MGYVEFQYVRGQNRVFRNHGFTITEVLIAVAILGLVAVGATTVMTDIFKTQSLIVDRDEANEFSASLSRFLNGDSSCSSALNDTAFPTSIIVGPGVEKQPGTPLKITGYSGYGAVDGGALETGVKIGRRLRIKNFDMKNKGVAAQPVVYNAVTYNRYVAQIRLQFEQNSEGKWKDLPPRFFEFPVLVDATGVIRRCQVDLMISDACEAIGSKYDAATGVCLPTTQCQMKGSYITTVCSPAGGYGTCHHTPNPLTGAPSCPSGVMASHTGHMESSYQAVTGAKKPATAPVYAWIDFYVCMQCN